MSDVLRYRNTVDGKAREGSGGDWIASQNPFTGETWAEIPRCTAQDATEAVEAAHRAFRQGAWPALTATARGKLLRRLGDLILRDAETLARIEVRDNGKLFAEMHGQLRYIPEWFHYYGGLADKIEGGVLPLDKAEMFAFTKHEPLGVVVAITPWNSPLLLLAWKLAPALAAGCTVVIKPSEFTSCSTLALMALIEEAGFPPGVVNTVTGYGAEIGTALTEHPLVAKVAFTGGDATGAAVYGSAAKGLKHVTLELGGKSPNIIFDDARIEDAVKGAISGIFAASGQTCIAGSRLLVQRSIREQFIPLLVEALKGWKPGHALDPETRVGAVVDQRQLENVLRYIDIGKEQGGQLLAGGVRTLESTGGLYVEPTIFDGVTNAMTIAREEIFGPVLSVISFDTEEEALQIANDSIFGLAAGVWTANLSRAHRFARGLRAGSVWVNQYDGGDMTAPFGGFKQSGNGRDKSLHAFDKYTELKATWIKL